MNLFEDIQSDILGDKDISSVLRKAKVLAYRLGNREFKEWVEYELNGYYGENVEVPDYRKFHTPVSGTFRNLAYQYNNVPISLAMFDKDLKDLVTLVILREGTKELEAMVKTARSGGDGKAFKIPWPADLYPYFHNTIYENMACLEAHNEFSVEKVIQILDTVRNRLLSFILELSAHNLNVNSNHTGDLSIPDDQVKQIFNFIVLGNHANIVGSTNAVAQGGAMSVFDQRNQKVNNQYNAAGNINFDTVKNADEFIDLLEILKSEVAKAKQANAIDEETSIDAEYKITKAIQQAKKPSPDKKSMLENITGAKELLTGATSAVGLVTSLIKAAELVQKLF